MGFIQATSNRGKMHINAQRQNTSEVGGLAHHTITEGSATDSLTS